MNFLHIKTELESLLQNSSSRAKEFKSVIELIDDDLIGVECICDEYFKILSFLMEDPRIFNKKGSYWLFWYLDYFYETQLSIKQKMTILESITRNHILYSEPNLIRQAASFVAKNYSDDEIESLISIGKTLNSIRSDEFVKTIISERLIFYPRHTLL